MNQVISAAVFVAAAHSQNQKSQTVHKHRYQHRMQVSAHTNRLVPARQKVPMRTRTRTHGTTQPRSTAALAPPPHPCVSFPRVGGDSSLPSPPLAPAPATHGVTACRRSAAAGTDPGFRVHRAGPAVRRAEASVTLARSSCGCEGRGKWFPAAGPARIDGAARARCFAGALRAGGAAAQAYAAIPRRQMWER
jgi:hypothetical protein